MVHITLYVAGAAPSSRAAKLILDELTANADVTPAYEVIDVLREPAKALQARLIATPTLIIEHNGHQRRYVGEIRNRDELQHMLVTFTGS